MSTSAHIHLFVYPSVLTSPPPLPFPLPSPRVLPPFPYPPLPSLLPLPTPLYPCLTPPSPCPTPSSTYPFPPSLTLPLPHPCPPPRSFRRGSSTLERPRATAGARHTRTLPPVTKKGLKEARPGVGKGQARLMMAEGIGEEPEERGGGGGLPPEGFPPSADWLLRRQHSIKINTWRMLEMILALGEGEGEGRGRGRGRVGITPSPSPSPHPPLLPPSSSSYPPPPSCLGLNDSLSSEIVQVFISLMR